MGVEPRASARIYRMKRGILLSIAFALGTGRDYV
jgi:hypothetical protein